MYLYLSTSFQSKRKECIYQKTIIRRLGVCAKWQHIIAYVSYWQAFLFISPMMHTLGCSRKCQWDFELYSLNNIWHCLYIEQTKSPSLQATSASNSAKKETETTNNDFDETNKVLRETSEEPSSVFEKGLLTLKMNLLGPPSLLPEILKEKESIHLFKDTWDSFYTHLSDVEIWILSFSCCAFLKPLWFFIFGLVFLIETKHVYDRGLGRRSSWWAE